MIECPNCGGTGKTEERIAHEPWCPYITENDDVKLFKESLEDHIEDLNHKWETYIRNVIAETDWDQYEVVIVIEKQTPSFEKVSRSNPSFSVERYETEWHTISRTPRSQMDNHHYREYILTEDLLEQLGVDHETGVDVE